VSRFANDYPANWREISIATKEAAGHRCVRCHHPFTPTGSAMLCDVRCDDQRGFHLRRGRATPLHMVRLAGINYGVHHLDGDKSNCAWWNLLALCNSCHLTVQSRVIVDRPWILDHSDWFRPYVAGFYAHYYGELAISREEAVADIDRFLSMGQPHLHEVRG
jgi:hypothetical protein